MPDSTLSLTFLSLLLLFSFNSGGMLKISYGFDKTWRCVPKPSTTGAELEANMNFACAEVGALGQSRMTIQQGGPCCYPNNLINHASVSMSFYYHLFRGNEWNCNFRGSGLITFTYPSYKSCQHP